VIVADTSPFIALTRIDRLDLLRQLQQTWNQSQLSANSGLLLTRPDAQLFEQALADPKAGKAKL